MLEEGSGANSDENGIWVRYDVSAVVFHHDHISQQGRRRHHLCGVCTKGLGGIMAEVEAGSTVRVGSVDKGPGADEEAASASARDRSEREGPRELSDQQVRAREVDAEYLREAYGL